MISLRPGSHTYNLLRLLCVIGEYPVASLALLGSTRTLYPLIQKLGSKQDIRFPDGSVHGPVRVLSVSGKRPNRTIRLHKDILPILGLLDSDLLDYYLGAFFSHHFPGGINHILRNHRVAEVAACFMAAGIEYVPYRLPALQNTEILREVPGWARFYLGKNVKRLSGDEFNKTMYSRMAGVLFYPGGHYTVYNTRGAVMRWKGLGEAKVAISLDELARWNNGAQPGVMGSYSALLFGSGQDIALETLRAAAKDRQRSRHFNSIYQHIHYIPLGGAGIRLLRVLTTPDWNSLIIDSLFPPQMRMEGVSNFDAQRGGLYYVSHLDSDLARLIRLKQSITTEKVEFLCYPWQAEFIRSYFGEDTGLRIVELNWLEAQLGID